MGPSASPALAPSAPLAPVGKYVVFRLADSEYAIPTEKTVRFLAPQKLYPVFGAPAYVAGAFMHRKRMCCLIDLRIKFGFPTKPADSRQPDIYIVVTTGGPGQPFDLAFAVDEVLEVIKISESELSPHPAFSSETLAAGFIVATANHLNKRTLFLLDADRALAPHEMEALDGYMSEVPPPGP